ncbi:MAG: 50S ribosomal protein L11 methyltransferase [Bacteroidales bacterium]|jgi:ribosomal protein L11 methyltransferase|nr:50S ribosomal protein L11 methyltransferase [Bacteroidales bacterium]
MENYIEVSFNVVLKHENFWFIDIFKDELLTIGFESFVDENNYFKGYIPQNSFNIIENFDTFISNIQNEYPKIAIITYSLKIIEPQNWNEKWEQKYESVVFDDFCIIRPPFNPKVSNVKYDIIIEPKMSFGTAHHPTTSLMIKALHNNMPANNKQKCMDMGCGTAVLAILAKKIGYYYVEAVDNDNWAIDNSFENAKRNNTEINIFHLNKWIPKHEYFDIFLANINRNILLENMETYSQCVKKGGKLLLSGFYEQDSNSLILAAEKCKMKLLSKHIDNSWALLIFLK